MYYNIESYDINRPPAEHIKTALQHQLHIDSIVGLQFIFTVPFTVNVQMNILTYKLFVK